MADEEFNKLLNLAIEREIYSQNMYLAGEVASLNPAAKAMMKELAGQEKNHTEYLEQIKQKGLKKRKAKAEVVPNLMISEYLEGGEKLDGAGLQDTLVFAVKHEQQAIEFYSALMSAVKGEEAKKLCEQLVREELRHKLRLEMFYDDIVFMED